MTSVFVQQPIVLKQLNSIRFSIPRLKRQTNAMLDCINCPGGRWDLGVMLTTNSHIHYLNRKYRHKNKPTDVLSFPFHYPIKRPGKFPRVSDPSEKNLGDLYLSIPYIYHDCQEKNLHFEQHIRMLMAHGICHLLGYDHEKDTDYEQMLKAEAFILSKYKDFL